jgi:hypothetical protein
LGYLGLSWASTLAGTRSSEPRVFHFFVSKFSKFAFFKLFSKILNTFQRTMGGITVFAPD